MSIGIPSIKLGLCRGKAIGPAFTPLALFSAGQQGGWYDPSDFATLFQDTAGATPVTATGQSVALMRDKSGRSNHLSQAVALNRPVLQIDGNGKYYLAFNGTSNNMQTASAINLSATDKVSIFTGIRKTSDLVVGVVADFSNGTLQAGSLLLTAPLTTGVTGDYGLTGGGTTMATADSPTFIAPDTAVLTGIDDISGASILLRRNGSQIVVNNASQGTGNFGTYPLTIGSRATAAIFFTGNIYSLIFRAALSSTAEIASAETYVNSKTGAY